MIELCKMMVYYTSIILYGIKTKSIECFSFGFKCLQSLIKSRLKSTFTQDLESQILHWPGIVIIVKITIQNHPQLQHKPVLPSRTQNVIPYHPVIPYPACKKNPVPAFIPLFFQNVVTRDPVPHPVSRPVSRKFIPHFCSRSYFYTYITKT